MEATSDHEAFEFRDAWMRLRAPRAAIVFRADDCWHDWARLALYASSSVWGGRGFVLVPHTGGEVDPVVLRAVAAYDPDYVVGLQVSLGEFEAMRPGRVPLARQDGSMLNDNERAEMLRRGAGDHVMPDPDTDRARVQVVAACAPYRQQYEPGKWVESVDFIAAGGAGRPLTSVEEVDNSPVWPCLAAPPSWGGALGVAIAACCGMVEPPAAGDEPTVDDAERYQLTSWLADPVATRHGLPFALVRHPPGAAVTSVKPADCPLAFERTTTGLSWIAHQVALHPSPLVVLGDSAVDFAVAMIWDRTYGSGHWLPSALATGDAMTAAGRMVRIVQRGRQSRHGVRITTRSATAGEAAATVEAVQDLWSSLDEGRRAAEQLALDELTFPAGGKGHWAVEHHWDQTLSLPITRDEFGGAAMVTSPPPPVITIPPLSRVSSLSWQVDVNIARTAVPPIRPVPPETLLATGEHPLDTWVRTGRHGISYESQRFGLVLAGASPAGTLARPRLRIPGLMTWARAMARHHDRTVAVSDDGRRARTLGTLWGSRENLTAAMAGPLRQVLEAFQVVQKRSTDAYPRGGGIVIADEGYLTFQGMVAAADGDLADQPLRATVDELTASAVLVRGLVLGCSSCGTVSFVQIDQVAQDNVCPRCAVRNSLTQPRWTSGDDIEPPWFYDLHPVVRTLLAQRGHVPLLLSEYLRSTCRRGTYADTPEIVISDNSGNAMAEIDLIALADDQVLVAEAKHTDGDIATLGSGKSLRRAAYKRVVGAETLTADEVLLATTAAVWEDASVAAVRDTIVKHHWPISRTPALRTITGLGTADVRDEYCPLS